MNKKRMIAWMLCLAFLLSNLVIPASYKVKAQASSSYLLKINKGTNVVTVYQKDSQGKYTVPYKAFICSTGNDTPLGTFRTPNKFRWQPLIHDVWGQYCTQITGNILFHSVYYNSRNPADVNVAAYNVLGTTASAGCVRLKCGDAKWIYDNCALGTTVTIFQGSSKDDPLGKPSAMKISTGWDPTDPDSKNPWHNKIFSLQVTGDTKVEYGSKVKLKQYITLTDVCGTECSKKKYLKVNGKVNTKKLGKQKVTYSATDKLGKTYSKVVTFKVVDTQKPVFSGVDNVTIERNSSFDAKKGVSVQMVSGKKLKKKMKVTGKVDVKTAGVYTLQYKVKGTNGKSQTVKRKITVADTQKPVIKGIADTTLTLGSEVQTQEAKIQLIKEDVMKKLSVTDNGEKIVNVAEWTVITVTEVTPQQYQVTLTVTDKSNNKAECKVTYLLPDNSTTQEQQQMTTQAPQTTEVAVQ